MCWCLLSCVVCVVCCSKWFVVVRCCLLLRVGCRVRVVACCLLFVACWLFVVCSLMIVVRGSLLLVGNCSAWCVRCVLLVAVVYSVLFVVCLVLSACFFFV